MLDTTLLLVAPLPPFCTADLQPNTMKTSMLHQRLALQAALGQLGVRGCALFLKLLVTIAVPFLLIVGSIRLTTSESFLSMEYQRQGFPADKFGLSMENRLEYGVYGIRYLTNDESIVYLRNLTLPHELCFEPQNPGPCAMFNAKELQHMEDVKGVFGALFMALRILLLLTAMALYALSLFEPMFLRQALKQGSLFTLGSICFVVLMALVGFRTAFSWAHKLFFAGGSWVFKKSDTLIRLYPQQFWMDATFAISFLTLACATLMLCCTWRPDSKKKVDQSSAAHEVV
mmetsp:Transcript_55384/g.103937  ORF Transcript_55384/g.103937 Transcript_55384/m.103937 type:complete len:287 (+) Transcript_55384:31-891(+)